MFENMICGTTNCPDCGGPMPTSAAWCEHCSHCAKHGWTPPSVERMLARTNKQSTENRLKRVTALICFYTNRDGLCHTREYSERRLHSFVKEWIKLRKELRSRSKS